MSYTNKKYSKFIATAATATLVASAIAPAASATSNASTASFTDVSERYKAAVDYLVQNNITVGLTETSFGIDSTITRGDAAIMLAKALGLMDNEDAAESGFTDVPTRGALAINSLKDAGIVNGKTATRFGFNDNLTRGEVALLMANVNAYNFSGDVSSLKFTDVIGTRYESAVAGMVEADITSGKTATSFGTGDAIKRGDFAIFLYKAEQLGAFTEVSSIEATTTRVDNNTAGQFLGFTVNGGKSVSLQDLKDAGYTIEFQSTTAGAIKDASTGELVDSLSGDINYKVVVSKDGQSFETELTEVEVLDFETYLTGISEVTVTQGSTSVTSGNVTVQDGEVNVVATKATTLSGATVSNPTVTYTSSNPSVASVNATTGVVTPIKAGIVTITATADDATVSVPLNVVSGAREATTATATTASIKLLAGKSQNVDFTVVDQFGDEFDGDLTFVSRDDTKATGSGTVTVENGKATATLTAVASGETIVDLKAGTETLQSVNIAVSNDSVVATRNVETVSPSADLALDVVKGSDDKTVNLVWNQYNADGFLIGAENDFTIGNVAGTYTVSSSDANVATVAVAEDGTITVTGISEGTTNLVIKEGTITRATAQVTVTNSTPTVTGVNFETVEDVVINGALNKQVLKAEGVTLSSTEYNAEISEAGIIFIDVEGSTEGYDVAGDITLGALGVNYSGTATDITNLTVNAGSITGNVTAGANGTLVPFVKLAGQNEAFATSTINVNVPQ